jgi:PncC family amidohydrolase
MSSRRREKPEAVVGRMLRERGLTLAVAESCTGGLVSARITDVPGSSVYFRGGVVAYANSVKREALGVAEEILQEKGAVSAETAGAMAGGVRKALAADIGIGVTGIAGPAGGTAEKPVGLVYIALAHAGGCSCVRNLFSGGRLQVRQQSAEAALALLREFLETRPDRKETGQK